ncbi:MAG: cobalamin biosynthesis protein CobD/CbiB [Paraglaciecola psychrophila]|jgi:cobalamin biosynthesis protein CobD/CbiB
MYRRVKIGLTCITPSVSWLVTVAAAVLKTAAKNGLPPIRQSLAKLVNRDAGFPVKAVFVSLADSVKLRWVRHSFRTANV